jgi:hypothetical protein
MSFKYILRIALRGSGNLKRYLIMIAIFETIFLSLITTPIGYLNETLQIIPKPSFWIASNPPGIEIDYSYLRINNKDFLIISSPNLSDAIKLLIGEELRLNEASIGCQLKGSEAEEYLKSKLENINTLTYTNTFLDYSIILKWSIFQEFSKSSYSKIYLKTSSQDGIAAPSAWNLAKDLVELIRFHGNFLFISLTMILSIICCILGLRSTSDLEAIIESLEEIHIPRSNLLLNLSIIATCTMLIGMLGGYGLVSIITPLTLIYLRQILGIPYIYTTPSLLTIVSTFPLALLSLISYLVPITWRIVKK